jgi:hypothetical protein
VWSAHELRDLGVVEDVDEGVSFSDRSSVRLRARVRFVRGSGSNWIRFKVKLLGIIIIFKCGVASTRFEVNLIVPLIGNICISRPGRRLAHRR